jgi:hypothetical protein
VRFSFPDSKNRGGPHPTSHDGRTGPSSSFCLQSVKSEQSNWKHIKAGGWHVSTNRVGSWYFSEHIVLLYPKTCAWVWRWCIELKSDGAQKVLKLAKALTRVRNVFLHLKTGMSAAKGPTPSSASTTINCISADRAILLHCLLHAPARVFNFRGVNLFCFQGRYSKGEPLLLALLICSWSYVRLP